MLKWCNSATLKEGNMHMNDTISKNNSEKMIINFKDKTDTEQIYSEIKILINR